MASDVGLERIVTQPIRFEFQDCGVNRLEKGHTTGWRSMPGLMVAISQTGTCVMDLSADVTYRAEEGTMLVLSAGRRHRVTVTSDYETRVWAHINYYFFDSLDLFSLVEVPIVVDPAQAAPMCRLIATYSASLKRSADESNVLLRTARMNEFGFRLLVLLAPLCRMRSSSASRINRMNRFGPVIEYMSRNLSRMITRDDLAKVACLSPSPFHAAFREAFGVSPMRFLLNMRMRQAQRMLLSGDSAVGHVAESCGYSDPFCFSKAFRKHCGMPPSAYRRKTVPQ